MTTIQSGTITAVRSQTQGQTPGTRSMLDFFTTSKGSEASGYYSGTDCIREEGVRTREAFAVARAFFT